MRFFILALICAVALTGCGKKKEKVDIVAELESKPIVTEVKPEAKPEEKAAPEPKFVDNNPNPASTDVQPTQAPPMQMSESSMPSSSPAPDPSQDQTSATAPSSSTQGFEMTAQKVGTPSVPASVPAPAPQAQASYPPYQAPAYTAPQGAAPYPPRGYYPPPQYGGYPAPPPKKYVPPGPIETVGEFIGHLVNPFKRDEDESKKEYKGI